MAVLVPHRQKKLICFLVIAVLVFFPIGNVEATKTDDTANRSMEDNNKTPLGKPTQLEQQKTFKKDLKINPKDLNVDPITEPTESDDHSEKLIIIDASSVIETDGKAIVQSITSQSETPVAPKVVEVKTGSPPPIAKSNKFSNTNADKKNNEEEKYVIKSEEDASDSLKTGFYFFLILSTGAIMFIVFKIFRQISFFIFNLRLRNA